MHTNPLAEELHTQLPEVNCTAVGLFRHALLENRYPPPGLLGAIVVPAEMRVRRESASDTERGLGGGEGGRELQAVEQPYNSHLVCHGTARAVTHLMAGA